MRRECVSHRLCSLRPPASITSSSRPKVRRSLQRTLGRRTANSSPTCSGRRPDGPGALRLAKRTPRSGCWAASSCCASSWGPAGCATPSPTKAASASRAAGCSSCAHFKFSSGVRSAMLDVNVPMVFRYAPSAAWRFACCLRASLRLGALLRPGFLGRGVAICSSTLLNSSSYLRCMKSSARLRTSWATRAPLGMTANSSLDLPSSSCDHPGKPATIPAHTSWVARAI